MMIILHAIAALLAAGSEAETIPLDELMQAYEVAIPRLKEIQAEAEADIGRTGTVDPKWATSGLSVDQAIAAQKGDVSQNVLGEWEVGGHGVTISGDRPLVVPPGMHRYIVREYQGPINYHDYYRLTGGVVIHTFGLATGIGHASCRRSQGMEIIAPQAWQDWSVETALVAVGTARATRDDVRIYCTLYRPTEKGSFTQLSYTPDGAPYMLGHEKPQSMTVTRREVAAERIFADPTQSN